MRDIDPVTSGELPKGEFLEPMGISQYRLAKEIGVPAQRLCRFFGLSNGYWLRAQAAYDIEVAEYALADQLSNIRPWNSGSPADRRAFVLTYVPKGVHLIKS